MKQIARLQGLRLNQVARLRGLGLKQVARLKSRRFSSFDPDFTPRWESGCDCKVNLASRNLYSLDAVFTIKDVQSILQRLEFIKEKKSWSIAWSWDRSFLLLFFVVSLLSFFFLKSYFFSWWKACFLFSWILLFFLVEIVSSYFFS